VSKEKTRDELNVAAQLIATAVAEIRLEVTKLDGEIAAISKELEDAPLKLIPESEVGEFVSDYVDVIAERGANLVHQHIEKDLMHPYFKGTRIAGGIGTLSRTMNFHELESVIGNVGKIDHIDDMPFPLPMDTRPGRNQMVMMFLFKDQIKDALKRLLTDRPVKYNGTSRLADIGSGRAERRAYLQGLRDELKAREDRKAELKDRLHELGAKE
jgi:hypothetical protein